MWFTRAETFVYVYLLKQFVIIQGKCLFIMFTQPQEKYSVRHAKRIFHTRGTVLICLFSYYKQQRCRERKYKVNDYFWEICNFIKLILNKIMYLYCFFTFFVLFLEYCAILFSPWWVCHDYSEQRKRWHHKFVKIVIWIRNLLQNYL